MLQPGGLLEFFVQAAQTSLYIYIRGITISNYYFKPFHFRIPSSSIISNRENEKIKQTRALSIELFS
jgi:hypothetical protein